jgi:L-lactate dehydrogenase complex protein LldE
MSVPGKRVGLFVTCLVDLIRPQVGFAAAKLIEDAGFEVVAPESQTCCGQPAWNAGADRHAKEIASSVIETFLDFDYVVAPSGSCAGMIKRHFPEVFADDAVWLPKARTLAQKTYELMSFLVRVGKVTRVAAKYRGSVCCHDSCSALREMGVREEPRVLLKSVEGLSLVEANEREICCGFGGLFSVKYPEISQSMADDKLAAIAESGADTLVGPDLGCLLHLAGRLEKTGKKLRVRHAAEVLADMGSEPGLGEG